MRGSTLLSLLVATLPPLTVVACASSTPTSTAAPSASPLANSSAPGGPPSAELAAGWAAATAPASPFVLVGEVPSPSLLFAVEGALFVAAQNARELPQDGKRPMYGVQIGVVHANRLEFPEHLRIEGGMHRAEAMVGKWPDRVDMIATTTTGRTGMAEHFALTGQGWLEKRGFSCSGTARCAAGTIYTGLERIGDSLVALEAPSMFGHSAFVTLQGPEFTRKLTPRRSCEPDDFPPLSNVEVIPEAFSRLKDGSLVSFGHTCTGAAMIETWKPQGGESTLVPLVDKEADVRNPSPRFIHGPAGETYLLTGRVFRESGGVWSGVPVPEDRAFFVGTVASDGALWIAGESGVFRREQDRWERVVMPEGIETLDALATFEGQVWATARNLLLRQRKPGETGVGASIKPAASAASASKARKLPSPGSPRCGQNLVVLYAFTKVTPDDYDFPLTRKALTGHMEFQDVRFLVTRDGGSKFFTAQVSSFEQGKKLAALIEKEMPNAKPQLVCADPEVVREVRLNLGTGKVIP